MLGVYQRGSVWWIRFRFQGRLIRQPVGRDRKLAEKALTAIRGEIVQGRYRLEKKGSRVFFKEMAALYLKEKEAVGKRSLGRDKASFKNLIPFFGGMLLTSITRQDVEAYRNARRKQVSGATTNRELALLKHMLNIAIEKEYLTANPACRVRRFPEAVSPRRKFVFSEDELQALVNAAAVHLKQILVVAIGTGLRKGDNLGLRWDQVDFEHNVITLFTEKTEEGVEVPMLPMVREMLWRMKATAGQSPFVLTYHGKGIRECKTAFHGALRRSGLAEKGYRFHDLRRTFATMLYNRGVHLTKIQRLLGHKSVTTTERYLGVKFEETRTAITVLDCPGLRVLGEAVGSAPAGLLVESVDSGSSSVS